ncbi:hypothetical protein CD351_08390 [Erythrobacter sp. KY5]|uniref:hypothetical protein n=1 Tax=Erythrobacter sp. KY5 TaxID=2011159 RepID=UPI000DBF19B5|nr:hypothetical protein [Erythrobacter sp. KY5]AWW74442.1 hypothetical protein CD351_08390 [Erythrobacter sp. KY5]
MRGAFAIGSVVLVAACGPTDSDYEAAIERRWPVEQQAQLERAAFLQRHAESFERSAERSAGIARRLGTDNELADGARETAQNARFEQEEAEYIAGSKFISARDISCAPASPMPGENCEATVTIEGSDGERHDMPGAWRFDQLDGRIEVVGTMER